ncbi:uncharacterized protein LOC127245292 isoform X2 [Andrographis paniculata]|uniref:uncharacterized protein LOC127245292 isoform X2 n=1 Tax=Andrographis paniculata TaxID=175694 RepID=UPI0021E8A704|nr:uncharacterized protein LOC127245292 isoform X2 [Andrographis paniculata]
MGEVKNEVEVKMECAGKGSRSPCGGPATRRCHRCRAVAYCSVGHQVSHWSVHRGECSRLEQQMKRVDVLKDFPFTFGQETAEIQETRCSFLIRKGIHRVGMWTWECSCGQSDISFDNSRYFQFSMLINCWNLPSELCPCKEPSTSLQQCLTTWKDYCQWRCIPFYSPAALLLHWPLTVYWAVQLSIRERLLPQVGEKLRIHYLGPEKELLQLAVFGELQALFPGVKVHIDLIGPAIPNHRNGEQIDLCSYPQCCNIDCQCKHSFENCRDGKMTSQSPPVTLLLHAGCYHDFYKLAQDFPPQIIIAPNAGVAAYTTWLPTLKLIKEIKVPAIFSDYCEEASHLATRCISSWIGTALKFPIQLNPFRQPFPIEDSALCLPCYSNCFLFGF